MAKIKNILTFILFPVCCFSQERFEVYVEAVPGQTFCLVNDSLFPHHIQLTPIAEIIISDSVQVSSVNVTINSLNNTLLHSETFSQPHFLVEPDLPGYKRISCPIAQLSGLNSFTVSAVLNTVQGTSRTFNTVVGYED